MYVWPHMPAYMRKQSQTKLVAKIPKSAGRPPVVQVTRKIGPFTQLELFVRAGGRCEFNGCNEFLLEHRLTLTKGNFAQMAHIVAFSRDGPRGNTSSRP